MCNVLCTGFLFSCLGIERRFYQNHAKNFPIPSFFNKITFNFLYYYWTVGVRKQRLRGFKAQLFPYPADFVTAPQPAVNVVQWFYCQPPPPKKVEYLRMGRRINSKTNIWFYIGQDAEWDNKTNGPLNISATLKAHPTEWKIENGLSVVSQHYGHLGQISTGSEAVLYIIEYLAASLVSNH